MFSVLTYKNMFCSVFHCRVPVHKNRPINNSIYTASILDKTVYFYNNYITEARICAIWHLWPKKVVYYHFSMVKSLILKGMKKKTMQYFLNSEIPSQIIAKSVLYQQNNIIKTSKNTCHLSYLWYLVTYSFVLNYMALLEVIQCWNSYGKIKRQVI